MRSWIPLCKTNRFISDARGHRAPGVHAERRANSTPQPVVDCRTRCEQRICSRRRSHGVRRTNVPDVCGKRSRRARSSKVQGGKAALLVVHDSSRVPSGRIRVSLREFRSPAAARASKVNASAHHLRVRVSKGKPVTCCLAVCMPRVSIAAADTRIRMHHDSGITAHDGPQDLLFTITSKNTTIPYRYSYRKIRKVADGWVVSAGEALSGTAVLDALKAHQAILFTQARRVLARDPGLFQRITAQTGVQDEQLRETLLIGAPFASDAKVWMLGLRPQDQRSNRSVGGYALNMPLEVPQDIRRSVIEQLDDFLCSAIPATKPVDYAKALARVIQTAASHAPDTSALVQFGGTFDGSGGSPESIYFEGACAELSEMSDEVFELRRQIAE